MKKLQMAIALMLTVATMMTSTSASANLISNPSFETLTDGVHFDDWYGANSITADGRTGTYSALLTDGGGSIVSDYFSLSPSQYEYGAWFSFGYSIDPRTLNGWPDDRPGVTVNIYPDGGTPFYPNNIINIPTDLLTAWTLVDDIYWSDWITIGGMFDLTTYATNAAMNIYVQNYAGEMVYARVDDAFVTAVPEPSTFILLGAGLAGLALLRKKRS